MADLTDQLQLNLKINEAIKERSALMEKQRSLVIDQIALQRELCNAIECIDVDKMNDGILKTKESLNALFEATSKVKNVSNDFSKTGKAAGSLAAGTAVVNKVFGDMGKILGAVSGKIGNFVKGTFTIVKSLGQVAKSIISIPFKMLDGLVDMANRFAIITELSRALEDVREKFGDLDRGTGKILKDSIRPMTGEFNKLTAAGHSFSKTFGRGPAGMAKALEFNAELMEKLNGGTERLRNEIGQNIAAMAIYRKGMGFTAEQQATLVALADAQGKNIVTVQHEYAKFSLGMAKRFGLDSKLIGKAMADMTADVGNFGTLSTKQLAQVATYTQKLGIETKALQGVVKKYDDFESAAKSAAMLNQTFGMQIDVLKMLKDEDPASRLSQLQKSFQATGRSYESLSRAERRRMAELAGLDDKSAELAFSQRGLSMSYEDVQAAGEETEVGFKDINETIKELAKNMKKILEEPAKYKGFFAAFTEGFSKGAIQSEDFMGALWSVRNALTGTATAGKEVGKLFVQTFPGVKQFLNGIKDFFKAGTSVKNLVPIFKKFFEELQDGPKKAREAAGNLWRDLTGNFTSFFGGKSGASSQIMSGLQTFAGTLGNIALGFAQSIMRNVTKAFNVVGEFFKNMKTMSFGEALSEAIGTKFEFDAGGWFSTQFGEGFSEIGTLFVAELWPSIRNAFLSMWDWLHKDVLLPFWHSTMKPWLKDLGKFLWEEIKDIGSKVFSMWWNSVKESFNQGNYGTSAAIFLAPFMLIFGPVNMFKVAFFAIKNLSIGLSKGFSKLIGIFSGLGSKLGSIGSNIGALFSSGFAKNLGRLAGKAGPWAMLIDAASNVSKAMENLGKESIERYGMGATKAGAGLSSVIQTLTLGLLPESMYTSIGEWFAEFFGGGEQGGLIGIFKSNLTMAFALISDLLMGLWDTVKGLWDVIMGILTFDFDRISNGLMKVFAGIGNMVVQMGFTVTESVLNSIKRMIVSLKDLPWIGGLIPDGAVKAIDEWIGKTQSAAAESRRINAEIQAQQSARQEKKSAEEAAKSAAKKSAAASPTAAVQAAQTSEETEKRLNALRAADVMLKEVEKLKGVDKKLEEAIKQMPTEDKIALIKSQTSALVTNLNKTFSAMRESLDEVEIDDTFKADMFDNKILLNMKNIIDLKENIKNLAGRGPSARRIETSMENLKLSLKAVALKSAELTTQASYISINLDSTAMQELGMVNDALEKLKQTSDSLMQMQGLVLNPKIIGENVGAIGEALNSLANSPIDAAKTKIYFDAMNQMVEQVQSTMDRFVKSLPENVLVKAQQTVAAVEKMDQTFRALSNKEVLATAVKIGESFNGGGTVTFRHENININLAVNVEMSAEQIARGVIKAKVKGTEGKADQEVSVVTNPNNPDFDF
jgi:hypothetical protein